MASIRTRYITRMHLLIFSVLVLLAALIYDTIFAGIPYPDPTPEMFASYMLHSRIAGIGYVLGFSALLMSMLFYIVRRFFFKKL